MELSDVKIDVRIAQREAKTAEDQVRALQEKQKWGEKLQAEVNVRAEQLQGEHDKVALAKIFLLPESTDCNVHIFHHAIFLLPSSFMSIFLSSFFFQVPQIFILASDLEMMRNHMGVENIIEH